jgi:hypothetical protein
MKSYQSYAPSDSQVNDAAMIILNDGGWLCKEHFVELLDQWIDDSTELNYQQQLQQEQQHEQV